MTIAELLPPAVEPVTLVEVKAHLRLDTSDEDALLTDLIRTARLHLESVTGLCLFPGRCASISTTGRGPA